MFGTATGEREKALRVKLFFVLRKYQSIGISTSRQTVRLIKRRTSRAIYNLHQLFFCIFLCLLCLCFMKDFNFIITNIVISISWI